MIRVAESLPAALDPVMKVDQSVDRSDSHTGNGKNHVGISEPVGNIGKVRHGASCGVENTAILEQPLISVPLVVFPITVMKPLFIPLKREHFEAFKNGTKPNMEEYRPEGPRWNARTCPVGRSVVLSLGYGKRNRLFGKIAGYRTSKEPTQTAAWKDCYGDRNGLAACIKIEMDGEVQ